MAKPANTYHDLTTSYLGNEVSIPAGTKRIEFRGMDARPATATAAIWVRLTSQAGDYIEDLAGAGENVFYDFDVLPGEWTYNVKAVAGTPVAFVNIA